MSSRDPRDEHAPDAELALDRELSAFLDGELSPERHAALLREIESDPELAQRAMAFRDASQALRALPTRELSKGMAASLREAIDSGAPSMRSQKLRGEASVVDLAVEGRRKFMVVAAAAAAAALLLLSSFGEPSPDYTLEAGTQYVRDFEAEALQLEDSAPASDAPRAVDPSRAADLAAPDAEPLAAIFDEAADEDLALAVEYETLQDLDVIRDLDLLEALVSMNLGGAG